MRQLFRLSRRVTLRLLNGLFDETFAEADVTDIHYEDNRFTTREGQQRFCMLIYQAVRATVRLFFNLLQKPGNQNSQ
ncbi:MAG: hypothetical protein J7639_09635 [Paenibacillaceae bacterium]|nr:hypothetical protein [Paenibacillaceae bacterium]